MATDPRRFDQIEKVVRDNRRNLDDVQSTVLARLAAHTHAAYAALVHTHAESDVTSLVTDLAGKAASVHTHEPVDITAATLHEARYEQTTLQAIANATDTKLKMNTGVTTCSDVVASGTGNTDFALNRDGLWRCSASVRFAAGTTGERHLFMGTGTTIGTLANRFIGATSFGSTLGIALAVSTDIRVTSGTSVFAGVFQTNGGSLNTDVGFGHSIHIALTWLRP
jgi:hypothetical protein